MAYATYAELVTYMVTVPVAEAEATRLLARASELVDELLVGAWYPVDTDGLPTETEHEDALRDATCAQAAYFTETGDDQGTQARYTNVRIGDVSLSTGGRNGSQGNSSTLTSRVAPHAVTILRNARLLPTIPIVRG